MLATEASPTPSATGLRCRDSGSRSSRKWRNPIGIVGAVIVGFNVLIALFGKFIWTLDPNDAGLATACRRRAGRTRWARTSSGATRSPGSSTARRSRCRSGSIAVGDRARRRHADRPARRLLRGLGRRHADARRRLMFALPGPRARDRDRRAARAEPAQRDDRDRDRRSPRRSRASCAARCSR